MNVEYSDGTLLWEMFSPWGKYYWRTCQYCFCYLVSMYVLLLIGMILSLRNIIRDQEPPVMLMICQLGFIGIVVFFNVLGSQWKTDVQSDARNPAGKCSEYRVFLEKLITKTSKIIIDHYNAHVVHCIRYYSIVYRREVGSCAKN